MQSQKSFEPPLHDVTADAMSSWTLLTDYMKQKCHTLFWKLLLAFDAAAQSFRGRAVNNSSLLQPGVKTLSMDTLHKSFGSVTLRGNQ